MNVRACDYVHISEQAFLHVFPSQLKIKGIWESTMELFSPRLQVYVHTCMRLGEITVPVKYACEEERILIHST